MTGSFCLLFASIFGSGTDYALFWCNLRLWIKFDANLKSKFDANLKSKFDANLESKFNKFMPELHPLVVLIGTNLASNKALKKSTKFNAQLAYLMHILVEILYLLQISERKGRRLEIQITFD